MNTTLKRYFVALLLPESLQAYAIETIELLRDRYGTGTAKAPPHITLAPPFHWSPQEVHRLEAQLQTFGQAEPPVNVQIAGFAAFAPRVLYLNVVRSPKLLDLQARLTIALESHLGIVDAHKTRPFAPHITVASRRMTRSIFRQAWAELESRAIDFSFTAEAIVLLEHDGRGWQVRRSFWLSEHRAKSQDLLT
ncbi:2'-5' RNA ligase family protein [Microcoleus sp. FACHB-1515]|uniref:2'-5' RNA ligase family protein n=1 Tax=Cyanophyceae TaxID=3028117 RepID=UPI0016831EE8|nr:2'-5' RNA ligase family protein [Microcoleus sp. FACHB-1515]MBD2089815.1 2'-5' RNA ligase family protein [Microcoleus sp. FACHB-1515]